MHYKNVFYCKRKKYIDLNFDLVSICNLKCSYCNYNVTTKKLARKIQISYDEILKIISEVKKSKNDFVISLLGGEPTLYKNLYNTVKAFSELKNVLKIYIYTNGTRTISEDILRCNKVHIVCTFHAEQNILNRFLENIWYFHTKTCELSVIIMCEKNQQHINAQLFNAMPNDIQVVPGAVIRQNGNETIIETDGIEQFKRNCENNIDYPTYFLNNEKIGHSVDVFNKKINQWKNWHCFMSCYHIDTGGKIIQLCSKKEFKISDISTENYIICPKYVCTDDCYFEYDKKEV